MDSVMDVEKGEIEIPKFKTSSKIKAKDVLQSMGLESAFEEGAFRVFAEHPAQLTELRQNAVIEVSESGTKAAAITVGGIDLRSGPLYDFIADRPFMYLIRRMSTKEIIFIGHFSHFK
ncbi:serine protease inhibitor [Culex quinquefasciatus]|uniref:Serine protease inhibitor n=2 Tax=Culex quinquefasciatus TaxID=7176 RepID=B0WIB2_CULQU|nr:serine protease inhibitor [Culex quinquefasciatus]|eukprot:XP_001848446.1 serine protease inhibitor [Culex quinquefasciatus]